MNQTDLTLQNNTDNQFEIIRKTNLADIEGFITVTTTKPTYAPKTYKESRVIWNDSGTYKICYYIYTISQWHYATLSLLT